MVALPTPPGKTILPNVGQTLAEIRERFADADRRAHVAAVRSDAHARNDADDERIDIAAENHAAAEQLADLFLLLMRHAFNHRRKTLLYWFEEILAPVIREVMAPEIEALSKAVVKLEDRCK